MNPSNSSINHTGEKLLTSTPALQFPKVNNFNPNNLPNPLALPSFPPLFVPPPPQQQQLFLQQLFSSASHNATNPTATINATPTVPPTTSAPVPNLPPLFLPPNFLLPLPPHLMPPPVLPGPLLNTPSTTTISTNSPARLSKTMESSSGMTLDSKRKLSFSFPVTPNLNDFFVDSNTNGLEVMNSDVEKALYNIFSPEKPNDKSAANLNSPSSSSTLINDKKLLKRGRKAVSNDNLIPISDKPYVVVKAPRNVTKRESKTWTDEDDQKLVKAITENSEKYTYENDVNRIKWSLVIEQVLDNKYTTQQAYQRYMRVLHPNLKRDCGWTPEEDEKLIQLTEKYGQKWSEVAREMNFTRADVWCRQRFRKLQAARMNGIVTPSLSQFHKKNLKKSPISKKARVSKAEEEDSPAASASSSPSLAEFEDPDFSDLSYDDEEEEHADKNSPHIENGGTIKQPTTSISIQNGDISLQKMLEQKARTLLPEGFPMGTITFVSMMSMPTLQTNLQ